MPKLLKNKVCLVTGASRGIGKAIAEKFAEHRAIVIANAREQGSIDDWAAELSKKYNTEIKPFYFDVRETDEVKKVIMDIKKKYKRLDVLVNNAGVVTYEMLGFVNTDKLREMFEVNVVSPLQLMQLATRLMGRQENGSIINISSLVGVKGVRGQLAYSVTKGAINTLTLSASKELASKQIRVNAVAPGMIATNRLKNVMSEKFQDKIDDIGFERLGKPVEVADVCLFLASDLSTYVTGQIIGVEGSLNI